MFILKRLYNYVTGTQEEDKTTSLEAKVEAKTTEIKEDKVAEVKTALPEKTNEVKPKLVIKGTRKLKERKAINCHRSHSYPTPKNQHRAIQFNLTLKQPR